jgi:hypothetical protein
LIVVAWLVVSSSVLLLSSMIDGCGASYFIPGGRRIKPGWFGSSFEVLVSFDIASVAWFITSLLKLAFDSFAREAVGSHDHENFPHPIAYFLPIITSDKDIVDINKYTSAHQNLLETHIHHSLKHRKGIAHAEIHHEWLEQPSICEEGGLPLIPFPNSHIVKPPAHVNDCIVLCCL